MARSLELRFCHRPADRPIVDQMVESIRQVFAANGADITLALPTTTPLDSPEMNSVSVSGCHAAVGEHRDLFERLPGWSSPNQALVFVVRAIVGSNGPAGCAKHPLSRPGVVINASAAAGACGGSIPGGRWVLAHEIGHLLGLPHAADRSSLMFEPATAISGTLPLLSSRECRIMESSPLLGPAVAGPRRLEPRTTPESTIPTRETPSFARRRPSLLDQLGS